MGFCEGNCGRNGGSVREIGGNGGFCGEGGGGVREIGEKWEGCEREWGERGVL